MKPTKFLAGAVVTAIGGLAITSIASATAPVTVESNGDLTVCGIEYVSDENGAYGCITIQGKNVGAQITSAGPYAPSTSYGDYFQWGDSTGHTQADWNMNNVQSDNAWGGESDNYQLVYPIEHESNRKGPCDEGYHVPSRGEIYALMDMWAESGTNGYIDSNNISQFYTDFQIPFAGRRYSSNGSLMLEGSNAIWWSSTPDVGDAAWKLDVNKYSANAYNSASALRTNGYSVRCFKNSEPKYIELTDTNTQVTVGQIDYNGLPNTMEVTINNEVESHEPVLGEVSVSFGSNESAKFSKLVKVNIPVENAEQVIIKVKHAGSSEYNYDGLTTNVNASCNNGRPTSSQYNGAPITVVNGYASIYTCEASSFVALGLGSGEAIGEVTLTLTAGENTCTLNDYNLGTHNVSSEDQNVSTSGQNIVCEFLKNTSATIQLSMGDLVDGTKEIGRQYFTGIVTSLGNSLGTIANLTGGSYNFLSSHVIYTKEANTIGTWTGSLAIEGIIPAGTPSGEYTGELNIIICEGC